MLFGGLLMGVFMRESIEFLNWPLIEKYFNSMARPLFKFSNLSKKILDRAQ